jgi:hypothetical protein
MGESKRKEIQRRKCAQEEMHLAATIMMHADAPLSRGSGFER